MILFDDNDIRVIYAPKKSTTLVITFPPRSIFADGEAFWGGTTLDKIGVSAIGVMPKDSNWFAPAFMKNALWPISEVALGYTKVILYGASAGAYAAAKWSRRLGAHFVLCLGPQWTIEPEVLGGNDLRWNEFYTPSMAGMEIRKQDLSQDIFVFYDPYCLQDNYHAESLLALGPNVKAISTPYMHHTVTELFAGSGQLADLIGVCGENAWARLTELAGIYRRRHKRRLYFLLAKSFEKRPERSLRLLKEHAGPLWTDASMFVDLGNYVKWRKQAYFAREIFRYGLSLFPDSEVLLSKASEALAEVVSA